MKYLLSVCALLWLCCTQLAGQDTNLCVPLHQTVASSPDQTGGRYISARGLLHVLIVFAQFPDDSLDVNHPAWPKDQPPQQMNQWVDSVWTGNPTPYSMTDYFNDMSLGQFRFTGKTRFIVAPRTRQEYRTMGMRRQHIHTEILQVLDSTLDFAEFDRWDPDSHYVHIEQPDKIVDLVVVVWRNIADDIANPASKDSVIQQLDFRFDQADLGFGPDVPVDIGSGNRLIKLGVGWTCPQNVERKLRRESLTSS